MSQSNSLMQQGLVYRVLLVAPFAVIATVGLFAALAALTSSERTPVDTSIALPVLDFTLVREDSDVNLLDRRRLPEFQKDRAMPSSEFEHPTPTKSTPIDMAPPIMAVPDISIEVNIDMGQALSEFRDSNLRAERFAVDVPYEHNPRLVKNVSPRYPSRALRKGIEGQVEVEFIVEPSGEVKQNSVRVMKASPKGVFEQSVLRALKRSRFEQLFRDGQPVAYRAHKIYHYEIPK